MEQAQEQLREQETTLIDTLLQFALELQETQKTGNPQAVVGAILSWTNGQQELTEKVSQVARMVLSDRSNRGELAIPEDSIPEGKEAEWVEQLIRACAIEKWETQVVTARHLRKIRSGLVKQKQQAFGLLTCYRHILEQQEVVEESRPESQALLELGLIERQRNRFKVHNRIYQEVFNLSWVEQTLLDLRPYLKPFKDWQASGGYDKAHLLRGEDLQEALKWAADKSEALSLQEHQFLMASQVFGIQDFSPIWQDGEREALERFQDAIARVSYPQTAVQALLRWTNGQPNLLRVLGLLVCHRSEESPNTPEALELWVDRIVQTQLVAQWETAESGEPLRQVRDRVLDNPQEVWQRLNGYLYLLQRGQLSADSSTQQELLDVGLIANRQGAIAVHNPIYEAVFSQRWVNQTLLSLRPYARSFTAWLKSKGQDNTQLLSGSALQEALNWARGKTLNRQDIRFLKLSQVWDLQDIQQGDLALQTLTLQTAHKLLKNTKNPKTVIQGVLEWTGGQPSLLRELCQRIVTVQTPIPNGEELTWLEQWVREQIVEQWETIASLRELRDRLSNNPQSLATYQQILQQETVAPDTPESQTLLQWGLIRSHQGQLQIANRLYPAIFNTDWIRQILEPIPEPQEVEPPPPPVVDFLQPIVREPQPISTPAPPIVSSQSLTWKLQRTLKTQTKIVSLAFSPDESLLISLGDRALSRRRTEHHAIAWNLENGKKQQTHYLPHSELYRYQSITFTPEHQLLACACLTKKIAIFDVQQREMLRTLHAHMEGITFATFSPNGQTLISSGRQGNLKLWNPHTGELLETKSKKLGRLRAVAMSADRYALALVNAQSTITVHLSNGKIFRFNTPNESWIGKLLPIAHLPVHTIALSGNKYTLATGGEDRKIRLWNLRTQELCETLNTQEGEVSALAFSSDGQMLANSNTNGNIEIWRLS